MRALARSPITRITSALVSAIPPILLAWTILESTRTEGWGGIGIAFGYLIAGVSGTLVVVLDLLLFVLSERLRLYAGAAILASLPILFVAYKLVVTALTRA